jgi:hypothetical protein
MSAIQFKTEPLGSNKAQVPAQEKSAGATLIELGVALARAESRAPIPGLCSRCLSYRDPRSSTAQYPNIFCSERCEQEFVRLALASLTLEKCARMHARLNALLTGAQKPSL